MEATTEEESASPVHFVVGDEDQESESEPATPIAADLDENEECVKPQRKSKTLHRPRRVRLRDKSKRPYPRERITERSIVAYQADDEEKAHKKKLANKGARAALVAERSAAKAQLVEEQAAEPADNKSDVPVPPYRKWCAVGLPRGAETLLGTWVNGGRRQEQITDKLLDAAKHVVLTRIGFQVVIRHFRGRNKHSNLERIRGHGRAQFDEAVQAAAAHLATKESRGRQGDDEKEEEPQECDATSEMRQSFEWPTDIPSLDGAMVRPQPGTPGTSWCATWAGRGGQR